MIGRIKKLMNGWLDVALLPLERSAEQSLLIQAQLLRHANRLAAGPIRLSDNEFRVSSQWGEDGIIDWLVESLPEVPTSFVEFGVQDYRESNTRLLLQLRNWRGLVIDGSSEYIADIRRQDIYWRHQLEAKCAFIDRNNINDLILEGGLSGELGLLSVDIDGNDYWVWQAIHVVRPWIVVCEYNAVLGDRFALSVPYESGFQRTKAHSSNLYFGASIRAIERLALAKGYVFVGTASTGCNAFFVRADHADKVLQKMSGVWAFPSAVRESRDESGNLTFVSGVQRAAVISHLPLFDTERNSETTLEAIGDIYSPEWRASKPREWN